MEKRCFAIMGMVVVVALITQPALAQNSLGVGGSEQAIRPDGAFAGFFNWVNEWQRYFFEGLRTAITALKEDPSKGWYLVALSFAYGVFHAVGPGHGKVVISSYMLANEVAARRGIFLSFASALVQGLVAIVIMGTLAFMLRGTGIRSGEVATFLEVASYGLVTALGVWLIWRKIIKPIILSRSAINRAVHEHGKSIQEMVNVGRTHAFAHAHGSTHTHGHAHTHQHVHDHNHDHAHDCGCGHDHAADPSKLEGEKLKFREAVSAVASVGVRPCTGALVVLAFAFLNGLYLAGIGATLAMSIGTGFTVAGLATIAVGAKGLALRIAGMQEASAVVHRVIEGVGAILLFSLGALLFMAALSF